MNRKYTKRSVGLKAAIATAIVMMFLGVTVSAASAEGSFSSSLSGVRSGFASRVWNDRNADGASTTLTISGCSRSDGANFRLEAELIQRRTLWRDRSFGRKNVAACRGGVGTANWGRVPAGDYFIRFWHQDFGTVSARSLTVRY